MKKAETAFFNFPLKAQSKLNRAAKEVLGRGRGREVSFIMIPDARIKALNRRYRGVNRITDIISFRLSKKPLCGDIYIARGRSRKQAKTAGNTWEQELCYLVIHGILHLFDYTDYTSAARKRMFAKQDSIFRRLFRGKCIPQPKPWL